MKLFDKYHVLKAELSEDRKDFLLSKNGGFLDNEQKDVYVFDGGFVIEVNGIYMKVLKGDILHMESR